MKIYNFSRTLIEELTDYKDDFEIIHTSLNVLYNRDIAMRSILSHNKQALRSYILKKIILGEFTNKEELNKSASLVGMHFDNDWFRVLIVSLRQQFNSFTITNEEFITFVENHFPSQYNIYGTDTLANNNFIFIVSSKSPHLQDIEKIKLSVNNIKLTFKRRFDVNIGIGIGKAYNNIASIQKSYLEALIAIDSCFADSLYSINFYEEINLFSCDSGNQSINKELYDIQTFLRQGDLKVVLQILSKIQNKVVNKDNSILIIRHFCYSVYYSIIQTINHLDNILPIIAKDYMEALMFCNTAERFFELLEKLCVEICAEFSAQRESQNSDLCKKALKYIDEFYNNPDFSVYIMAEDLKVSPSYLSRYFKDQTGKTITEYLIYKRIEKAKELLRSTNEPIRSIMQHVGYQNETSFVRIFKKIEGVTPGMYRTVSQ
ncbi:MAG TPA: helix-turn-helix transcriptional regulator [Clostridiaceae bacterium]|nr:helix-turn-helix transcriptional regulator [Clostridiaceae bacterium]